MLTLSHPPAGEWVLVDDRHVERVGAGEPPGADRVVDLAGTTIAPAVTAPNTKRASMQQLQLTERGHPP